MVNIKTIYKYYRELIKALFVYLLSIVVFYPMVLFMQIYIILLIFLYIIYPKKYYKHFKKYMYNITISNDQLANAFLFGNPDITISGRMGYILYIKKKKIKLIYWLCKLLSKFFNQNQHCKEAIEYDRI